MRACILRVESCAGRKGRVASNGLAFSGGRLASEPHTGNFVVGKFADVNTDWQGKDVCLRTLSKWNLRIMGGTLGGIWSIASLKLGRASSPRDSHVVGLKQSLEFIFLKCSSVDSHVLWTSFNTFNAATTTTTTMSTFAWFTLVMGFSLLPGVAHYVFGQGWLFKIFFLSLDRNPHFGSFYLLVLVCSFHLRWIIPLTAAAVVSERLWKVLPLSVIWPTYPWGFI